MAEVLTTGWEPEVPAEDSLVRAYVLTTVDRSEVIARAAGGRVDRTDDVAMADSGSPVLFDNVATFLRPLPADRARAAVADALDFFPTERPFAVLSACPSRRRATWATSSWGARRSCSGPSAHRRTAGRPGSSCARSGPRFWVGYEGDEPVGTAGVYVAHGQNDVEWVSVYDRFRGRGYGGRCRGRPRWPTPHCRPR